jgi:hypothetical protein
MSAYLSLLKTKAEPKIQLLDELGDIAERTDAQQADYDNLLVELDGIKSQIEAEQQRETKARGHSDFWTGLAAAPARPRATAHSPRPDDAHVDAAVKSWSSSVFGSAQFENIKRGGTTMDPVTVSGLKAVYAPRLPSGAPSGIISGYGSPTIPPFRLLELMPMLEYNGASVPYLPMAATNTVAQVAWGAAKPEVVNTGAPTSAPMVTLAGIKNVARQSLRYIPGMQDAIDRELLYFVQQAITSYVMTTLMAAVTASASNTDMVTAILGAIALVEGQGIPVNGILIHPTDLAGIRALAWTGNKYLPAVDDGSILGYPTVPTSAATVGTALVGNFAMGAHLYVGEEANVRINDAPNSTNTVLFVAEADVAVTPDVPAWFAKAIDLP